MPLTFLLLEFVDRTLPVLQPPRLTDLTHPISNGDRCVELTRKSPFPLQTGFALSADGSGALEGHTLSDPVSPVRFGLAARSPPIKGPCIEGRGEASRCLIGSTVRRNAPIIKKILGTPRGLTSRVVPHAVGTAGLLTLMARQRSAPSLSAGGGVSPNIASSRLPVGKTPGPTKGRRGLLAGGRRPGRTLNPTCPWPSHRQTLLIGCSSELSMPKLRTFT